MHEKVGSVDSVAPRGIIMPIRSKSPMLKPSEMPGVISEIFDLKSIKDSLMKVDHDIAEMIRKRE